MTLLPDCIRNGTIDAIVIDADPRRRQRVHAALVELGANVVDAGAGDAAILLCPADMPRPTAAVPVLVYSEALPPPDDAQAFREALAPWLDRGAAFGRLAPLFGDAAIVPMARRLSNDLSALAAGDALDPSHAHRLGGFAGTLGFTRLAWCLERLSVGDPSFAPAVQREARRACATLRDYLEKRHEPKTLV